MTKEEAIEVIEQDIPCEHDTDLIEALEMAIKALEQEPILDKIKDEILNDWQIKKFPSSPFSCGLRYAVEIIEKYRGEEDGDSN